jgi:hypothetical protein
MKNPIIPGLVFLACGIVSVAQPDKKMVDDVLTTKKIVADTSKKKDWKSGGTFSLNLSQQNSSYWIGATEDYALSLGINADLYANYAKGKTTFDNTLKSNYAFVNNQSTGSRKTADLIDFYSKLGHNLNDSGTLVFATIVNARTQFANTYDYNYLGQNLKRRASGFAAPAMVLVTPGLDWRPKKYFSVFISPIAAKWILVTNDPYSYYFPGGVIPAAYGGGVEKPISENFGVDPARKVDFQLGAFLSAKFDKQFGKSFSYSSRLDLYSNYLDNPQNIDIFWTNSLMYKLNKWLVLTYQLNVAYDDQYHPDGKPGARTQFLGIFGIGVTAKF